MTKFGLQAICLVFCVVGLAIISGCGGGDPTADLGTPVKVNGKVTIDEKPLTGANILFQRTDKGVHPKYRNFSATMKDDGTYEVELYPGDYAVRFEEQASDAGEEAEGAAALDTGRFANYGLESELTAKVSDSAKSFNFDLKTQ